MRVLVASDSFKGSASCVDATAAIARGLKRGFPSLTMFERPLADGGEGTLDAILCARGGCRRTSLVCDPLGREIRAQWVVLADGKTAVIELAQAAGLTLLGDDELCPARASTFGVGQLMSEALDAGCTRIILAVGGSATVDGGAGLLTALGARLSDDEGQPIAPGGLGLEALAHIDASLAQERLADVDLMVACDVDNPLLGPHGAAMVFGPQKGANRALCRRLDRALAHYARCLARDVGTEVRDVPRTGAAGGTAGGLRATLGARLVGGAQLVMELVGFEQAVRTSHVIVTGEGRVDAQTLDGKMIRAVAGAAAGKPLVVLAGQLGPGHERLYDHGVSAMLAIVDRPMSLEEAMTGVLALLERTGERCGRFLALAGRLPQGEKVRSCRS